MLKINQAQFIALISERKRFLQDLELRTDSKWSRDIIGVDSAENFTLHFYRGSIELKKFSYNKNYRKSVTLLRYCSSGRHNNPDSDDFFDGPHVHLFNEDYGDKIAYEVDKIGIDPSTLDDGDILKAILDYCNVVDQPQIIRTLGI